MCNCNIKRLSQDLGCRQEKLIKIPYFMHLYFLNHRRLEKYSIWVDKCLVDEIKYLWSKGIITTGCCCGHNFKCPYIGVDISNSSLMKNLGYNVQYNSFDSKRDTTFYPKSVKTKLKFKMNNYLLKKLKIIDTDNIFNGMVSKLQRVPITIKKLWNKKT